MGATVTIGGFGELICLGEVSGIEVECFKFMFCLLTLSVIFHQLQTGVFRSGSGLVRNVNEWTWGFLITLIIYF